MKITALVSAGGEDGVCRFPCLRGGVTPRDCTTDGLPDRAKLLRALTTGHDGAKELFTVGNGDSDDALMFAAQFVDAAKDYFAMAAKEIGDERKASLTKLDKAEEHKISVSIKGAERRMRRGAFAYVTVFIDGAWPNLRCRVRAANPKEVVGNAQLFARDIAFAYVSLLDEFSRKWSEDGYNISVRDHAESIGLCAEAREDEARRRANAKRRECPRRVNGYCSPIDTACPCFLAGRCVEVKA